MNEFGFKDTSPESFREAIEFFADSSNEYGKDELYSAFVAVTRLYLDELISARQIENLFIKKFGENAADEFFEAVANSSEAVRLNGETTDPAADPVTVISDQFDLIERLNREV